MVSPRLQSADEISGAVDRTDAKLDGQFQRARLRAYDQLTGLATILVYLRRGQTAELSDVQTLGDDTDVLAWVGYDVLIAAPSGRIFDGGYVLGLANGVGLLYDSLNLRATGSETARDFALAPSVDGWTTSISPSEPAGALTVTSIEARLDSVSSTTPVIRLAAGGVTADYRAEQLPPSAFTVHPDVLALPIAVFRPAIEPFRMETAGDSTLTALADGSGVTEGHWRGATSTAAPVQDYRLAVSSPRPLMRIRGRLAVRVHSGPLGISRPGGRSDA